MSAPVSSPAPFEMKDVDRRFYEERVRDFIPGRVVDAHVHVWLDKFCVRAGEPLRAVTWPGRVANEQSVEELVATYALMFPGKAVTPLVFSSILSRQDDAEAGNAYVRESCARHGFPSLIFSVPTWSAADLEQRIAAGGFLGAKSYLSLSETYLPEKEIRVYDFFPHAHLEVLNRRGCLLMLHVPRDGRLRDPVNLAHLIEIEERYPKIKVVVAHVGRAYCVEDIAGAFEALSRTRNICFDTSANTNAEVFRRLIDAVGPRRILFGSDLPILRMRMRRICVGGRYVNLVPKGLYGDVSGDPHMREVAGPEAEQLTLFMYEEIDALRRAAEGAGLRREDVEDIFCGNATRLIEAARPAPVVQQLQMVWPRSGARPPDVTLPAGYSLRGFQAGDEAGYLRVMHLAGFAYWNMEYMQSALRACLPEGLFFVVHDGSRRVVATAMAGHGPSDLHPYGGELGWVAGDPEHKGRGLGRAVCSAALRRLLQAGYSEIYLKTDDFRVPALKVYLDMGFRPLLFAPDMKPRWEAIMARLGRAPDGGRQA